MIILKSVNLNQGIIMRNFQKKNKLKIFVLMASICAILLSSISLINPEKYTSKANSTASAVAFSSDNLIADLKNTSMSLGANYSLSKLYPIMSEDQLSAPLCWIYASTKMLETSLMHQRNEFVNLSEAGIAYLGRTKEHISSLNAMADFTKFSTIVTSEGVTYQSEVPNDKLLDMTETNLSNYSQISTLASKDLISSVNVVDFNGSEEFSRLSAENKKTFIKKYIATYGGVFVGIHENGKPVEEQGGCIYVSENGKYIYDPDYRIEAEKEPLGDHAVCLIGWDDEYGFLALNSWGTLMSEFYIPYEYVLYDTMYGYYAGADSRFVSDYQPTSSAKFNDLTKYTGTINNVICYGEDVTRKYKVDNSVNFNSVYVSVFKGSEDVTKRFTIGYDKENKIVRIDLTDTSNFFAGGDYVFRVYENNTCICVKTFYVLTGTEINSLVLEWQNLKKDTDELLNYAFYSSSNVATFYTTGIQEYHLKFSLTELNRYQSTGKSVDCTVSTPVAYSLSGDAMSGSELTKFTYQKSITNDINNTYTIKIPKLNDQEGKVVKFTITLSSNIDGIACSRDYQVNIFVSKQSTTRTKNANSIEYVLDGGQNAQNNLDRYPLYSTTQDASMTGFVLENPTKTGAVFEGWFTDADFTQKITKIDSSVSGDIVLYAKWTKAAEVNYFNAGLTVNKVTDYDGRTKLLSDGIVYGDDVHMKISFVPTAELQVFSDYNTDYSYYVNDELVFESTIARAASSEIFRVHEFPALVVGTYNIKVEIHVVISHTKSITKAYTSSFEVEQKTVNAVYSSLNYTYDNAYHKPTVSPRTGDVYEEDLSSFELVLAESAEKNAGAYTFKTLSLNNSNYKLAETNGCLMTISPKSLIFVWDDLTVTYNGKAQGPTYQVQGLIPGDYAGVDFEKFEMIDAGSYELSVDNTHLTNTNYQFSSSSKCTFVIEKATIEVVVDSIVDRTETDPKLRKEITYKVNGTLFDKLEDLKITFACEALNSTESGTYSISGNFDNKNYSVQFTSATYTLTGYYFVYYELPNGEIYKETVEEGGTPVGITDEIYKLKPFEKLVYSKPLESDGYDLHVVVTVKSNLWTVVIVAVIVLCIVIYWVSTRKQRKNKVN